MMTTTTIELQHRFVQIEGSKEKSDIPKKPITTSANSIFFWDKRLQKTEPIERLKVNAVKNTVTKFLSALTIYFT